MGRKIVCLCNLVDEKEIISVLKKGVDSTSQVQQITGAGRSCGRCLPEIDQLVLVYKKKKPKDLQEKLDFGF
jgi:bacterioferritin-associated ferredoxin